jgi:hypothetical protein
MNTMRIQQELALPRIEAPRIACESAAVNERSSTMTDQLAFDPSPVLGVFADVLNLEQLDAIAHRCSPAAMTYHDAGMVLAGLIIAAGEARETDAGTTWFAYVATAEVLARAMLDRYEDARPC